MVYFNRRQWLSLHSIQCYPLWHECDTHLLLIWGLWHQKQASQTGISNCIPHILWGAIHYSCLWNLLLAPKSSHMRCWDVVLTRQNAKHAHKQTHVDWPAARCDTIASLSSHVQLPIPDKIKRYNVNNRHFWKQSPVTQHMPPSFHRTNGIWFKI